LIDLDIWCFYTTWHFQQYFSYGAFATASDKVYQLLAHGRWFSLGTLASSTTKTDRHDIAEILLKVPSGVKTPKI
jgi:hypothetical protein